MHNVGGLAAKTPQKNQYGLVILLDAAGQRLVFFDTFDNNTADPKTHTKNKKHLEMEFLLYVGAVFSLQSSQVNSLILP